MPQIHRYAYRSCPQRRTIDGPADLLHARIVAVDVCCLMTVGWSIDLAKPIAQPLTVTSVSGETVSQKHLLLHQC